MGQHLVLSPGSVVVSSRRYIIESLLGSGAYGAVYSATEASGGERVAIKEFSLSGEEMRRKEVEELFQREAQVFNAIGYHPLLPRLRETIAEGTYRYIVRDYVAGTPLNELLFLRGRLTAYEIVRFAIGMGMALDHLHRNGYVLVDIKPDNVIVDLRHNPHLVDLGSALPLQGGATQASEFFVSEGYIPPELRAATADGWAEAHPRLDIYALGTVLFELAAGTRPKTRRGPQGEEVDLDPLVARQDVHHMVVAAVAKALSFDKDHRYDRVAEMVADLRAAVPPCMEVDRGYVDFGTVAAGQTVSGELILFNMGGEELFGEVSCPSDWVRVRVASRLPLESQRFRGNEERVLLMLRPPENYYGAQEWHSELRVTCQNAEAAIPLSARLKTPAARVEAEEPSVTIRVRAGGKAKGCVYLRNLGGTPARCEMVPAAEAPLQIRPQRCELLPGQTAEIIVHADASRLPPGEHLFSFAVRYGAGTELPVAVRAIVERSEGGLRAYLFGKRGGRAQPGRQEE